VQEVEERRGVDLDAVVAAGRCAVRAPERVEPGRALPGVVDAVALTHHDNLVSEKARGGGGRGVRAVRVRKTAGAAVVRQPPSAAAGFDPGEIGTFTDCCDPAERRQIRHDRRDDPAVRHPELQPPKHRFQLADRAVAVASKLHETVRRRRGQEQGIRGLDRSQRTSALDDGVAAQDDMPVCGEELGEPGIHRRILVTEQGIEHNGLGAASLQVVQHLGQVDAFHEVRHGEPPAVLRLKIDDHDPVGRTRDRQQCSPDLQEIVAGLTEP